MFPEKFDEWVTDQIPQNETDVLRLSQTEDLSLDSKQME